MNILYMVISSFYIEGALALGNLLAWMATGGAAPIGGF